MITEASAALVQRWRWPIGIAIAIGALALVALIALVVLLRWRPQEVISRLPSAWMVVEAVGLVAHDDIAVSVMTAAKRLHDIGADLNQVEYEGLGRGSIARRGAWRMVAIMGLLPSQRARFRPLLVPHLRQADVRERRLVRDAYRETFSDDAGREWLSTKQLADGSWPAATAELFAGYRPDRVGATALVVLASLRVPTSVPVGWRPTLEPATVVRAVAWLRAQQRRDGTFADDPRDHVLGLAAMARCLEVTGERNMAHAVEDALAVYDEFLRADAMPDDLALAMLETLALHACSGTGVGQAALARREAVVRDFWTDDAGEATPTRDGALMDAESAAALAAILRFTGEPARSPRLNGMARLVVAQRDLDRWTLLGAYGACLCAGPGWLGPQGDDWYQSIRQQALDAQRLGDSADDGSWGGDVVRTAIHQLMLDARRRLK